MVDRNVVVRGGRYRGALLALAIGQQFGVMPPTDFDPMSSPVRAKKAAQRSPEESERRLRAAEERRARKRAKNLLNKKY